MAMMHVPSGTCSAPCTLNVTPHMHRYAYSHPRDHRRATMVKRDGQMIAKHMAATEQSAVNTYRKMLNTSDLTTSMPAPGTLRGLLRASPQGHQFQSPANRSNAGPITIRTSVASIITATASVKPSILTATTSPNVNAPNTISMIAAALVMSPQVFATPYAIACVSGHP